MATEVHDTGALRPTTCLKKRPLCALVVPLASILFLVLMTNGRWTTRLTSFKHCAILGSPLSQFSGISF
ncbi:hypothetical protein GE21DRAFT_1282770, partial [Neurospora crassa]